METAMNSKILALVSAITAVTAFVPVAEAGNGVRLGFGFPMGTFVATPRGDGSAHAVPKAAKAKAYKQQQIARQSAEPEPKVAKKAKKSVTETASTKSTETTETSETTVSGSTALIQTTTPAEKTEETAPSETSATETPATDVAATTEPKAEETKPEEPAVEAKDVGCKKFIPAIGLTVTVGCEK